MKKFLKVVGYICLGLMGLHLVLTSLVQFVLRAEVRKYSSVEYESQLEPVVGPDGRCTFMTDGDFEIMQLNDLHLCGGIYSIKRDLKTINEVMQMVIKEKPDLVILNGDSVFAVPAPIYNGGGTWNNKMVSRNIVYMFNRLGVYWTVNFGNHDTESFNFYSRYQLGKFYQKHGGKYCVFESEFDDYGVSNQCIMLRTADGTIRKAIFCLDSNSYINNSLSATINWKYDTITDTQVIWAMDTLRALNAEAGTTVKSLFFFHIPIGEFVTAYRNLAQNGFENTPETEYISGVWDELVDEEMGERIWYGGCWQTDKDPVDLDLLFEVIGPDSMFSLEGVFCAHDHVNNAVVKYRNVILAYGNSLDNSAYDNIAEYGLQRGSMIVTILKDNSFKVEHKNAYLDYGLEEDVNLDDWYYPDYAPVK